MVGGNMAQRDPLHIAIHDSGGLHLVEGCPNFGQECLQFGSSGKVKLFIISSDGSKFALIANGSVQVLNTKSWQVLHTMQHPTAQDIVFSPGGRYLAVWCIYIKQDDTGSKNLHIYDTQEDCVLLKSFFQISQLNWQPQWTGDDCVFARNVTNEVHFYKATDLSNILHKRVQPKLRCYSISPSKGQHHVVFFTPSVKGAPCSAVMYKYPFFKEGSTPVASKSFYKIDTVEFMWNKACTAVLLMASGEKGSDASYYGEKMVFLMNVKTGEAIRVTFEKDGPVHAVSFTPDGKQFLAVFGNNPSQAAAYDLQGEQTLNFKEGPRNTVLINSLSNLAMVGGCGNISPRIEVWELKKGTQLCNHECPELTCMEWSPCGQYLLTATCSPRLRVNNGYRIYHYSGSLQYEYLCPAGVELFRAVWLPAPSAAKPFTPSTAKVPGIQSATKTASNERYVPPGARGTCKPGDEMVQTCKQFLRQIDKYDPNSTAAVANKPPPPLSKTALRNKKKSEAKRLKEEAVFAHRHMLVIEEPAGFVSKSQAKAEAKAKEDKAKEENNVATVQLAGDSDKRIKAIKKKLTKIKALKKDVADGKVLDKQQQTSLQGEKALLAEMKTLTV